MHSFSKTSKNRLAQCHKDLQFIFNEVIKDIDCSILTGHRVKVVQDDAYLLKKSKLKFPFSKHNKTPSLAVDAAPYPIDWDDLRRFYFFAGYVMRIATESFRAGKTSHVVRWGGDWDGDYDLKDQKFNDLVHFELI